MQAISTDTPLERFAQTGETAAFSQIVAEHIGLVYSAARRQVAAMPHLAEDVTQAVFIVLARKARHLSPSVTLSGWLINATYFAAADALKLQRRRQIHEQKAAAMHRELSAPAAPAIEFADIAPFLDKALAQLSPRDRDAIVLRFLEEKPLESVAIALGASPETARKRLQRALRNCRILAGRGFTFSVGGLATVLAARTIEAVPPGLTASVSVAAFSAATASYTSLVIAKGAILMMTWQKYQFAALCAAAVLVAAGALLLPQLRAQSPAATPTAAASATAPAAYTDVIEIPLRKGVLAQANFIDLDSGKSPEPPFAVPAITESYPGLSMTPQLTAWLAENHVSLIVITDPTRISVTGLRTYSHALPTGLPEGILNPADAAAQRKRPTSRPPNPRTSLPL